MPIPQLDKITANISSNTKIIVSVSVLILSIILFIIFLPLADGIILGIVLAYIARPIYIRLDKYRRLGALIATGCIIIPVVFIIGFGIFEIFQIFKWFYVNQTFVLNSVFDFIRSLNIPREYNDQFMEYVWSLSSTILPTLGGLGLFTYAKTTILFILNLVIAVLVCYFLLADGFKISNLVITLVPIENRLWVSQYIKHLDLILKGLFIGNAYAALFVSISSLIVFYLFGFPYVLALSTLIFIASLIPLFAGYMIILPLAIIKYFQEGYGPSIMFFVVSTIVIYLPPELILRPYLASLKSRVHPLLIMLAFLGGGFVGGISGFFLAPIILAAIIAAYRVHMGIPVYNAPKS